jgi:hypothetical protein
MRARLYLRQSLFSFPGEAGHVPAGAAVLEGELLEEGAGGLRIRVQAWFDERGRSLEAAPATLIVPSAKLDHALILNA